MKPNRYWMLSALSLGTLLALVAWPDARERLPVLGVLRGPLGMALLVLVPTGVLVAALGSAANLVRFFPRQVLFALAALVYSSLGLYYADRLHVSGDEPHYLLMAQSLWKDGDLDLRDNFARREFLEYVPALAAPHYGAPRADGRPFPAHSPGLPMLLAPAYALWGRKGCVLLMALLAAALTVETHALARRLGAPRKEALLAWAAVLGPPVAFYSFHIYTEVPTALAVVFCLRLLFGGGSVIGALGAALAASALPFLHVRMIPVAAALGLVAALRLRGRSRVVFLAVAALAGLAFLGYYQSVFGRPSPLAVYGGGLPRGMASAPARALAGLLLDRSFGLLPHAPVLLLSLAGVPLLLRLRAGEAASLVLVAGALLGPVLFWRMWWGGQCAPGRLLLPLVPFLAVALALRLKESPAGLGRWSGTLLACGYALVVWMVARPTALLLLNRRDRPTRVWQSLAGHVSPGHYLPSLLYPAAEETRVAWLWAGALCGLLLLDLLTRRRAKFDTAFRSFALPVALFIVLGAGVDLWARGTTPSRKRTLSRDPAAPTLRPRPTSGGRGVRARTGSLFRAPVRPSGKAPRRAHTRGGM